MIPDRRPGIPQGPIITLVYRVSSEKRTALLSCLRDAFPFYERHGGVRMGLYESLDDPGLFLELVAYASEADYAADQVRVEKDPATRAVLSGWRALVEGAVEVRRLAPIEPRVVPGPVVEPAGLNDAPAIAALLERTGLPVPGREDAPVPMLVTRAAGAVVGCVGWELTPASALLRSLAVDPAHRHRGLGRALVLAARARLASEGVTEMVLLTTSASGFFGSLGFSVTERSEVPVEVRASREFQAACCADATCMRLRIA